MPRKRVPSTIETDVLTASRRRCCVCFVLLGRDEVRKGQIAHLNRDPADSRFTNLVWLCLEHHDEYDSVTSQSKGLTLGELRKYRDQLYAAFRSPVDELSDAAEAVVNTRPANRRRKQSSNDAAQANRCWRFPLWLVANDPKFFAYTARNRTDGICLLERIDLPDGRIVIATIQMAGNPGRSITNAVEELCDQICERFDLSTSEIVWLQHYDDDVFDPLEWQQVVFDQTPPDGPFKNPRWITVTPEMWANFRLRPKRRIRKEYGHLHSKLRKLFRWDTRDLL